MRSAEPAPRTGAHRSFGRSFLRAHEQTDLAAPGLPPELAFLAAEGFSPERLLAAIGAPPKAVRPLDKLLSEGLISEEVYYRALARHLGCQYYNGDPPLAAAFDAMRGLRCGVAPLESRGEGPRAVIAPRAQFVPRLIEAAQSSRFGAGSFALTSPQRFAGLLRARRSEDLLDVALGRLPASLTARHGMNALQIAAAGAVATLACVLLVVSFDALRAVASAALWLIFSAMIILRSIAVIANNGGDSSARARRRRTPRLHDRGRALSGSPRRRGPGPRARRVRLSQEQTRHQARRRAAGSRNPESACRTRACPPAMRSSWRRRASRRPSRARSTLHCRAREASSSSSTTPKMFRPLTNYASPRRVLPPTRVSTVCRLGSRFAITTNSWLSHLFAIEYATLFDFINPGLCALDLADRAWRQHPITFAFGP